jgi:hypothetical protein
VVHRSIHAGKAAKAVKIVCSVAALSGLTTSHFTLPPALATGASPRSTLVAEGSGPIARPDLPLLDLPLLGLGVPVAELVAGLNQDRLQGFSPRNRPAAIGGDLQINTGPASFGDPVGENLNDPVAQATAVPEPASLALFGTALLVLGLAKMWSCRRHQGTTWPRRMCIRGWRH